jgi:hypothetical protein
MTTRNRSGGLAVTPPSTAHRRSSMYIGIGALALVPLIVLLVILL